MHATKVVSYFFIVSSIFLLGCVTTARAAATDPIAYWKFDEGTGSAPADSSGNNITGTFTSTAPTWSTDVPNVSFSDPYSLDFTRTGDAVYFSWPSGLNFSGTAPRSFSFWFKAIGDGENASGNYDRIMSWSGDAFEIAGTLGDITIHRLAFYDGSWRDTGYNLTTDTWYHITFTYDGTDVKLYVDDALKFSGTSGGRDINGTLYVGLRYTGDEGINGRIDDVRIYNYALTSAQIANLTAGSGDPDSPPDTTAPTISSVAATATSSGASVTWTTNEAASSKVVYSTDSSYSSTTVESDTGTRVTSHTVLLSSLSSCTTYNYKVVSTDAARNTATSSASTFQTSGCSSSSSSSSAVVGNGPIFRGSAADLPGYIPPRPQIIYPDGRVVYLDKATSHTTTTVTTATSKLCPRYTFTRDLKFGDRGEDVRALQRFLNCAGWPLATSGPGSSGRETPNYSDKTLTAVRKFQEQFASNILAPLGRVRSTGIFASLSRTQAYRLMQAQ